MDCLPMKVGANWLLARMPMEYGTGVGSSRNFWIAKRVRLGMVDTIRHARKIRNANEINSYLH